MSYLNRSMAPYGYTRTPEAHFHTPDGADHREMFEAAPGYEHYEHTSARRTINGIPVPVDAPHTGMSHLGGGMSHLGGMGSRGSLLDRPFGSFFGTGAFGSREPLYERSLMRPSPYARTGYGFDRIDEMPMSRLPPPSMGGYHHHGGALINHSMAGPESHYHTPDGADHREIYEAAPGYEHYEHTSARRTINGQPVPVEAPPVEHTMYGPFGGRTASF